jgi:Major Facilitator Superfamily
MPWRDQAGRRVGTAFGVHAVLVGTWAGRVPAIKHALHLTDGRLGVALFGMAAGTLAGSWAGGGLARRLGASAIVRAGIPAMAAALVATALAGSLAALTAATVCFGTIGAMVDVAMNALAVAVERDRRRPQMSGFHGFWSVGLLAGALVASAAAAAGIRPSVQFAVVGAAVVIGSARALAHAPRATPVPPSRRHAGRTPWSAGLVALGLIAFCSFFAEGTATDWSAVYLHDRAGAGAALAAAGIAGYSLAMAASRLVGDRIVARLGRAGTARRASVVAAAGLGLALAVPVPAAGVAGFALMGAGMAPIVPAALSAAGASGLGVEAAISRVLLLGYTGSIAGPAAIGVVAGAATLRVALLIPLGLIACIGLAAGWLDRAPADELANS